MNPEDVIVPELLTEGSNGELRQRAREMCQAIQDLDPYLTALAEAFRADQSEANLNAFLVLDAKRMEIDDVFSQQLALMRSRNMPMGCQYED